jgi:MFS family permease
MLLRAVLFICGAVVMSVEILAGRAMAVDFGSTLQVWGAIIGTFIGALSLGYWLGGVAADRWPTRLGLAGVISASGILISLVVLINAPVSDFVYTVNIAGSAATWLRPLIACAIIYLVPVMLLGAVSPYCVRLAAKDLSQLGKRVGGFYAISSLGSIFGTFLTAFYLIGVAGMRAIVLAEGLLLLALAVPVYLAGFFFEETRPPTLSA